MCEEDFYLFPSGLFRAMICISVSALTFRCHRFHLRLCLDFYVLPFAWLRDRRFYAFVIVFEGYNILVMWFFARNDLRRVLLFYPVLTFRARMTGSLISVDFSGIRFEYWSLPWLFRATVCIYFSAWTFTRYRWHGCWIRRVYAFVIDFEEYNIFFICFLRYNLRRWLLLDSVWTFPCNVFRIFASGSTFPC